MAEKGRTRIRMEREKGSLKSPSLNTTPPELSLKKTQSDFGLEGGCEFIKRVT